MRQKKNDKQMLYLDLAFIGGVYLVFSIVFFFASISEGDSIFMALFAGLVGPAFLVFLIKFLMWL